MRISRIYPIKFYVIGINRCIRVAFKCSSEKKKKKKSDNEIHLEHCLKPWFMFCVFLLHFSWEYKNL